MSKFILLGHQAEPCEDLETWAKWYETADRIVARTSVGDKVAKIVSTVFLGVNHRFGADGPPLLFETMIFPECDYCERCSTWEQAEYQHAKAIAHLENS